MPWETRFSTYDLVSHGTNTQGQNECRGSDSGGAGYSNSCIHSDLNDYSGGNTVWYNFKTASAGTISDDYNINIATESVCPKGWTLPTKTQIDSNRNVSIFSPVYGGYYDNGTLQVNDTYGYSWSAEGSNTASRGIIRYMLGYNNGSLFTNAGRRTYGFYIRCVSEEKTATDLTYMQDMIAGL